MAPYRGIGTQADLTTCARTVFGEATLDDLDDDENLEQHKKECELQLRGSNASLSLPWHFVGCGLSHPRTSQSTVYDTVQMIFLFYIVAMVPVRFHSDVKIRIHLL